MNQSQETTEQELQRALEAGRRRRQTQRRATSVRYDADRDAVEIELTEGAAVRLPRAMISEFRDVSPEAMGELRLSPVGYGIRLDRHDIAISVHGLVMALAAPGDIAVALGKVGGAAKTEKSRAAAAGAKGGRSRKVHRAA